MEEDRKRKIIERVYQELGIKISDLTKESLTLEELTRYEQVLKAKYAELLRVENRIQEEVICDKIMVMEG